MRFSFRQKNAGPRWVDSPDFNWVPESPLYAGPSAGNDIVGWKEDWRAEPQSSGGMAAEPAPQAAEAAAPQAAPQTASEPEPEIAPPAPANTNRAPSLLLPRLGIGLAQGLGLFALTQVHADPGLLAALSLALLFAPLVLLEGLGEIELPVLACWTAGVAIVLTGLGLHHHWRIQGPHQAYAGFDLALLIAVMLMVAQSLLRACLRAGKPVPDYRCCFDTAWTLAARLMIWAMLAGTAWALIGSGNSLFNWLRAHYPLLRLNIEPGLVILPLLGLVSAAAFAMTAGNSWPRRQMQNALLACATVALPMLVIASAAALAAHLFITPVSLSLALGFAALLLVCLNASYRGDDNRESWRKAAEFAAAFAILALAALAAVQLNARVAEYGWTGSRVFAAAAILLLGLYGLCYTGAALIAVGGGRWMQRIEPANRILALVVIGACLALATPLADPVALAVTAQAARLDSGRADPAAFDFSWLRREGLRFGQAALTAMSHSRNPEIARGAALTLSVPPGAPAPTPTEIGANITVRTPGARLPNTLLAHDWSGLDSSEGARVPPCLTRPALSCDAWFLDLDDDGLPEILLTYGNDLRWWASVMKEDQRGGWVPAATLASPPCRGSLAAMRAGHLALAAPRWRDLLVAGMRLSPAAAATLPCPR